MNIYLAYVQFKKKKNDQSIQFPSSVNLVLNKGNFFCFRIRKSQNPKEKVKNPLRLPQSQVKINKRKLKVRLQR